MRLASLGQYAPRLCAVGLFLASTAHAAITGVVYQDFNSNGVRDTATAAAVDLGLPGVTVTATCVTSLGLDGVYGTSDDVRTTYASAATLATGDYTIATTAPVAPVAGTAANPACRVSFSWDSTSALLGGLPNPLYGMVPAFVGAASNTATQFVNDGASNVNLGLNYPQDFCQNNPTLVTNCMRFGAFNDGTQGPRPALNGFPYTASGNSVAPTAFARTNQLGSTWGLAYHKAQKKVLVAAYLKRNIGVGAGGLGQIYSVDVSNTTTPTQTVTNFLNLEVLKPGAAGPNPRVTPAPAPGSSPTDPPTVDFQQDFGVVVGGDLKTGKLGIGDIDFSDDQSTLYAIGLNSRRLYIIPVGAALTAPAASAITDVALPDPGTGAAGCPADAATPAGELNLNLRPFALKSHKGSLYVGLTCTGESTTVNTNLRAFVYRYNGGTSFTQVANTTLNYNLEAGLAWNRWRDTADTGFNGCCFESPEPLLTDIEFAPSGDMLLGVRDRMGDATGRGNFALNGATIVDGRAHGDLIRACFGGVGSANPGLYDADNCTPNGRAYSTDTFPDPNNPLGGLTQVPGFTEVVTTAKDPVIIYSSGVAWYTNDANGTGTRGYQILDNSGSPGDVGSKASQMGDLEALCDAAPLEIGNRIWKDLNGNGVQDPGEPPIANVTVNLYAPSGTTPIATAVTDINGNYYFNNRTIDENGNTLTQTNGGALVNAITGLTANTTGFTIRLDNPANYATGGPLVGLFATTPNAGSNTTNNPLTDLTDSDAVLANPSATPGPGNFPVITFNTGGPGENNFGLDAGFRDPLFSLGNRVWFDTNNDGILNNGELPIAGVKVQLLDNAGNPIAGQTVVTDANGYYRFDGLAAGNYSVRVTPDNWTGLSGSLPQGTTSGASTALSGAPLAGYSNSTPNNAANGTSAVNNTDKGVTPATAAAYTTAGVTSAQVTLGATPSSNQPTGDIDAGASGAGVNGPDGDANDNLTVDFGFYRLTVGDTLWFDTGAGGGVRNDGIRNGTEPGVPAGVVVELLKGGVVVASTTTDANGNYIFTQQNNQGSSTGTNGAPLVAGTDYQVRVPASQAVLNGTTSSTNPASLPVPTTPGTTTNDDGDSGAGTADAFANATTTANFTLGASASASVSPDANGTYPAAQSGATNAGTNHKPNVDLGFVPPVFAIGNRVWFDTNNNGIRDAGEVGVDGVIVELVNSANAVIRTVATSSGGEYLFDNLDAGTYTVRIAASNWTGITGAQATAAGNPALTGTLPLAGYNNSTPDNPVSGATTVDATDKGITNATPATNGIVSPPVTLAVGGQPTGEAATGDNDGASPSTPGDAFDNRAIDFGFYRLSVGNLVFNDNGTGGGIVNDGIRNGGEPGIANVTVQLVNSSSTVVAQTLTDGNGNYSFNQLTSVPAVGTAGTPNGNPIPPGNYTVRLPAGQAPLAGTISSTDPAGGGQPVGDSRDNGTGTTPSTTAINSAPINLTAQGALPAGALATPSTGTTDQPRMDFGVTPGYSLGNRVWFDADNSGTVNGTEVGVDAVVVELLTETSPGSGTFVPSGITLTTANGGYYRFDGLAAGNYRVRVNPSNFASAGPLRGYFTSGTPVANADGDVNNDNNGIAPAGGNYVSLGVSSGTVTLGGATPEPTNDNTEAGTVGANTYNGTNSNGVAAPDSQYNASVDFGFHRVTIGNRVWFDTGAGANTDNGIYDGGEANVPDGTVVNLYSGTTLVATATTAAGLYTFTTDTAGNPLILSGAPSDITRPFRVELPNPPGASSSPTFSIGTDEQDRGQAGAGTAITSTVFTLTPGAVSGGQTVANATATTAQPQLDFGIVPQYSIGNRVWLDNSGDGIRQTSEPGRDGVVVNLLNGSGAQLYRQADGSVSTTVSATPLTTTTAGGGYYRFDNLPPGSFVVQLAPSNFVSGGPLYSAAISAPLATTATDVGGVDGIDNNSNGVTDSNPGTNGIRSGTIVLGNGSGDAEPVGETDLSASGQGSPDNRADMTVDFGFIPVTFSLGNRVWVDTNNNGFVDSSENGLDGATVNLLDGSGAQLYRTPTGDVTTVAAGNTAITTTTSSGGHYLFTGLPQGTYLVEVVTTPVNGRSYVSSTGINGATTGPFEPTSANPFGNTSTNYDHGLQFATNVIRSRPISLGAGQPTGEDGNVTPGQTDITPDNRSNLTIDFGVFLPASVGTVVWIDDGANGGVAGDGVKQPGEVGIPGVVVTLLDGSGNPVDGDPTTPGTQPIIAITGPNGQYSIGNLIPGTYQVEFGFPPGSTSTATPNPAGSGTPPTNGSPGGLDNEYNEMNPGTRRSPVISVQPGQDNPNLDAAVLTYSTIPPVIPTMGEWAMLLLAMLMLVTGAHSLRRRTLCTLRDVHER